MRIVLIDSGLGVLPAAAALLELAPDTELVLSYDPDGMPWGDKDPQVVTDRALICLRSAAALRPDAIVLACNTLSVTALVQIRAEFEPDIPVIATVPAIKPAALAGAPIAVWATARTTGSAYQRGLIEQFAPDLPVTEVACPGLADAVESGDLERVRERVTDAAARTPAEVGAVVLGCTQYELAVQSIAEILGPSVSLHYSGGAVARQVLRRVDGRPVPDREPARLTVLESGRVAAMPDRALVYADGRRVAAHAVSPALA